MKKSIAVLLVALFAIVLAVSCGEVENTLEKAQSKTVSSIMFFDEGVRDASYTGTKASFDWATSDYAWFFTTTDANDGKNSGKAVSNIAIDVSTMTPNVTDYPVATMQGDFFIDDVWTFTVKGYKKGTTKAQVEGGAKALFEGSSESKTIEKDNVVNISVELTDAGETFFGACQGYFGFEKLSYDTGLGTGITDGTVGRVIVKLTDTDETIEYAVFIGKFKGGVLYTDTEYGEATPTAGFTSTNDSGARGTDNAAAYYVSTSFNAATDALGTAKAKGDDCPANEGYPGTTAQDHPAGLEASTESKAIAILIQKQVAAGSWTNLIYGEGGSESNIVFADLNKNVFIYHNVLTTVNLEISGTGKLDLAKVATLKFEIEMLPASEPAPKTT